MSRITEEPGSAWPERVICFWLVNSGRSERMGGAGGVLSRISMGLALPARFKKKLVN